MEQVAYVRGDAQSLPFRDQSFDARLLLRRAAPVRRPVAALDPITRVLTDGGARRDLHLVPDRSAPVRTWEALWLAQSGMRLFERDEVVDALEAARLRADPPAHRRLTQFVGGRLAS